MKSGARTISDERERQVSIEGWILEHDDRYVNGELSSAAASYAQAAQLLIIGLPVQDVIKTLLPFWPWDPSWLKVTTPSDCAKKAGALAAAEIDRLNRLTAKGKGEPILSPYQQRVIEEKEVLDEKLTKLTKLKAFFETETFDNMEQVSKTLLVVQSYPMASYSECLGKRIAHFSKEPLPLILPDNIEPTLLEQQRVIAAGCEHKTVEELTAAEKVALCVVAGVPMYTQAQSDGQLMIGNTYPVGFAKVDGRFKVRVDDRQPPGNEIIFNVAELQSKSS